MSASKCVGMAAAVSLAIGVLAAAGDAALAQDTLALVRGGKPVYTIVVPDGRDRFSMAAATMLGSAVERASGARLKIVEETRAPAGPKVFIGLTRAAEKAGLNLKQLTGLTCVLKVVQGNLFLAGHDRSKGIEGREYYYTPATKKAVHLFLHDYAGVRWLVPNPKGLGTYIPRAETITFPADLDRKWEPAFDWIASGMFRSAEGFELNTSFLSSVAYRSYGGHSYYSAVPKEKYAKTHPEYFALLHGVRNPAQNHLCISNPEVQDLLYAEMLKGIDAGFSWVQLAQTDGYQPCQCEKCKALHPDIGERLWIVHNKLAKRLAKDRPNAKVVILSYGPTVMPPETIERFGKNVVIELCRYDRASFEQWRGKADAFSVYIYNWGSYHTMGFGPKTTPRMVAEQVQFFRDQGVRGIYCCGNGECWGLEGPAYYIFDRCLENPDCDWQAELDEFYRHAFGRAYTPMRQFYDAMFARLELYGSLGRWAPLMPGFKVAGMAPGPEAHYSYFFPPRLLKRMESKLARAKELEPEGAVRKRLDFVERAFLYVKDIACIFHFYHAYQLAPNWQTFEPLAQAIKQRNARIDEFFKKGGRLVVIDGFPSMFRRADIGFVRKGGRMRGTLSAPVNWDVDLLKQKRVLPGVGRKKIHARRAIGPIKLDGRLDEAAWHKAEVGEFVEIGMGRLNESTKVRLAYDRTNIYFAFECTESLAEKLRTYWTAFGPDGKLYSQDCLEVFLDPVGDLGQFYHFIFSGVDNSYYDAAYGLHKDPLHPFYQKDDRSWNGTWSYKGRVDVPNKRWYAEVAIPFKTLNVAPPTAGAMWKMNLGRERFVQNLRRGEPELSLWSPNLEARSFHSLDAFGDVIFE